MIDNLCNDFYTTINLNEKGSEYYQFIYASQLYGTFFSIYAKFTAEKIDDDPENIKITKIKIALKNYKGEINLGLVKASHGNNNTFEIQVQALNDNFTTVIDTFFEGEKSMTVSRNDKFIFERKLLKMSSGNNPHKNDVFDSEFYIKDGSQIIPRIRFEELDDSKIEELLNTDAFNEILMQQENEKMDVSVMVPGCRCIRGEALVTF